MQATRARSLASFLLSASRELGNSPPIGGDQGSLVFGWPVLGAPDPQDQGNVLVARGLHAKKPRKGDEEVPARKWWAPASLTACCASQVESVILSAGRRSHLSQDSK